MENNFDLDVNNYTSNDLIRFFKLENEYTLKDLDKKELELATEILSVNNTVYNPKYKFDIINFIKLAKEVLISYYHEMESNNEMRKNLNRIIASKRDPNVGRIINPLDPHQSLQTQIIPNENVNGYSYNTTTSVFVFNTTARENFFNSKSTDSIYMLPVKWKNVISISLSSINIPNVMFAFNNYLPNNQIFISEDNTGNEGIVILPEGNYTSYDSSLTGGKGFASALENAINTQLGTGSRFKVLIDPATNFVTISNTTNTFIMNVVKIDNTTCNKKYINNEVSDKTVINQEIYIQTLGYKMGFREIYYTDKSSYTSESIFDNTYSSNLFFSLNDHTGSQQISNTFGILKNDILDTNILGVIPLTSQPFTYTFDNNSNFIYKKREYFGPVDITKISIRLLNQIGNLVNLHDSDFSFSIQVTSLYDLNKQDQFVLRTPGFV